MLDIYARSLLEATRSSRNDEQDPQTRKRLARDAAQKEQAERKQKRREELELRLLEQKLRNEQETSKQQTAPASKTDDRRVVDRVFLFTRPFIEPGVSSIAEDVSVVAQEFDSLPSGEFPTSFPLLLNKATGSSPLNSSLNLTPHKYLCILS